MAKDDAYKDYTNKLLSQEQAFMDYKKRIFQALINKYGTIDEALIIMDTEIKNLEKDNIRLRKKIGNLFDLINLMKDDRNKKEDNTIYLEEKYEQE